MSGLLRAAAAATLALAASAGAAAGELEDLRARLAERFGGEVAETVRPTPVPGVYEVGVSSRVLYVSGDGRYVFNGNLIDLETRENLTEAAQSKRRLALLESLSEDTMIVFAPAGEVKHTITTFTDIDCPYCRRMHQEMAELNAAGIKVRYMLFPRAGVPSSSYDKAVSVWCADDRREAMTRAKAGEALPGRTCPNPVLEHMALAREFGLTGTPMTITDRGRVIGGYLPAERLARELDDDERVAGR